MKFKPWDRQFIIVCLVAIVAVFLMVTDEMMNVLIGVSTPEKGPCFWWPVGCLYMWWSWEIVWVIIMAATLVLGYLALSKRDEAGET